MRRREFITLIVGMAAQDAAAAIGVQTDAAMANTEASVDTAFATFVQQGIAAVFVANEAAAPARDPRRCAGEP
jgi:hypothetical protein